MIYETRITPIYYSSGLDPKNVIRVMSNQKWFVTDNDGKHAQQNIRLPGLGQKRCYVFPSKEWD